MNEITGMTQDQCDGILNELKATSRGAKIDFDTVVTLLGIIEKANISTDDSLHLMATIPDWDLKGARYLAEMCIKILIGIKNNGEGIAADILDQIETGGSLDNQSLFSIIILRSLLEDEYKRGADEKGNDIG